MVSRLSVQGIGRLLSEGIVEPEFANVFADAVRQEAGSRVARGLQYKIVREFLLTSFANQVKTLEARPGSFFI